MDQKFELAGNERHRFCAPVEIAWVGSDGQAGSTAGVSVDASVYGLGVVLPISLAVDTVVTVRLHGLALCGDATVRHVHPDPAGFRMGLQFRLTLFLQDVPGLDKILVKSLRCAHPAQNSASVTRVPQALWRLARKIWPKRQKPEVCGSGHDPLQITPWLLDKGEREVDRLDIRILIVEDNVINQKVAQLLLKRAGYFVDTAWNGREAVAACRTQPYHVVLMDCYMPVMDGFEATRHIRHLPIAQPVILAVTAHALAGYREQCLENGMDEYLAKPYQPEQLLALIQKHVAPMLTQGS